MGAILPLWVRATSGSLKSSGSTGPGGSGLGRVAFRTPVDVRWISAGFRVGQGGSGGKLGACVGRGAAVRCFGIGAEVCFGSAPSSSAGGRGRGARGAEARGVSALGGRGGCVLGGASEGRGRSLIFTSIQHLSETRSPYQVSVSTKNKISVSTGQ